MEQTKNNSFWTDMGKPIVVLVAICIVVSALLGLVHGVTAPVIAENNRITAENNRKLALPTGASFEELPFDGSDSSVTGVFRGTDDTGALAGYVVTASNKGYGGDVVVTVGFDETGKIVNVLADVGTETTGVGSQVGEQSTLAKFFGISGSANDVTLISGATYTSNAVRSGVNDALAAVAAVK